MYLILSLISACLSIFFFKKVSGNLSFKDLNLVSYIFWHPLLIQSFLSSVLVIYHVDNHYIIDKVYFESSRIYGWLAVQYCMICFPFTMWVYLCFVKKRKSNNSAWYTFKNKKIEYSIQYQCGEYYLKILLYILGIVCSILITYSFYLIKLFPFQGYLDNMDIGLLRQYVNRSFPGNEYIKNISLVIMPILSYIFYVYKRLTLLKRDVIFFYFLLIFSIFASSLSYDKSRIIYYFLGFFFLKVVLGDRISYKNIIKVFLSILLAIVFFYIISSSNEGVSIFSLFNSYYSGIIGRIILSQSASIYLSFDIYPSINEYIGFSSLTNLIGDERNRMAREIMIYFNSKGIEEGGAGVVNSLFIAEAWANWGILGVFLSVIWVAILVQFIFSKIIYGRKTPIALGIYAYLCYSLPITGGMNDFLYNPIIFITLFIFWGIGIIARLMSKVK